MDLDAGDWQADDMCKRSVALAVDGGHLAHREPRRVDAVYARGHQLVACLDIDVDRQVGQVDGAVAAVAEGDRAQAAALHLHWNCEVLVAYQRDFAAQGVDLGDLADHAPFVDDCLSRNDAMPCAEVHHYFMAERIAPAVYDFTQPGRLRQGG